MNFFNNNTTQLAIVSFMDWFSKLSIEKYQTISVSGEELYAQRKVIPVPCQYATREKFVEIMRSSSARRNMNPDLNNQVELQWILPRISVNMIGVSYDSTRRLIKTQKIDDVPNSSSSKNSVYSPSPYNLTIEVSSISRNIDENFQLMEQIIPFFSPSMSMNIKFNSVNESESVKITLDSITPDNPTDIPENDERLFTYTYSFTMQLNYFIPKKTLKTTTSVSVSMVNGLEVLKLDKQYLSDMNLISDKFSRYIDISGMPNPYIGARIVTPLTVQSTYTPIEYGDGQEGLLVSDILSELGIPEISLTQTVSGVSLSTALSGSHMNNVKIFYRLDDINTIYEYENIIPITFSKIYYWLALSTKTDVNQLEVYEYTVI